MTDQTERMSYAAAHFGQVRTGQVDRNAFNIAAELEFVGDDGSQEKILEPPQLRLNGSRWSRVEGGMHGGPFVVGSSALGVR